MHFVMNNYQEVQLDDLLSSCDGENKRMKLVFLHGKKSSEPLKIRNSLKNTPFSSRKGPVPVSYDRFFLFGVPSENRVVCMFTNDERHSRIVTRYHNKLFPGCYLWILDVKLKGTLSESENMLIHTEDPLIPFDAHTELYQDAKVLPPFDVDTETDMKFFCFQSDSVQLKFPVATTNLCAGTICDGQNGLHKENCICIEKSGLSEWGVRGNITCNEFQTGRLMHQECQFLSVAFSKFVTDNHRSIKPDSVTSFNPMLFRKSCKKVIDIVNYYSGFYLLGWFKPSKTSTDSFEEVHHYHVVRLLPTSNVDSLIESSKYSLQPNSSQSNNRNTTSSTTSDANATARNVPANTEGPSQSSAYKKPKMEFARGFQHHPGFSVEDFLLFGSSHETRPSELNALSGVDAEQPHNSSYSPVVAHSETKRLPEETHNLQASNHGSDWTVKDG